MCTKSKFFMKKTLSSIFAIIFLLSINMIAQNDNNILQSMQNKFNSLSDISANFVQLTNGRVNLKGKFLYKKKNLLKLEIKNISIISNGTTNWNYNKAQNKVIISNYDSSSPSIFSINQIVNDYPAKCKVTEEKIKQQVVLKLVPKSSTLNFTQAKIWLNELNLIKTLEVIDNTGNSIKIEFSNYRLNKKLPKSEFIFTPPKGSNVIDLR